MQNKEWQKLNLPEITNYIEFPLAFTGKNSALKFKGLILSCQIILAIIYTLNKAYKGRAKLTYKHFKENYGIYPDTLNAALKELTARGIIEQVKRSYYKIIAKFNRKNTVEIDTYQFKQLWNIGGKQKRLTYSRLITLAFLKRSAENPNTGGVFTSSQKRIATALNMPKSTAGDSTRELIAGDLIRAEKPDDVQKGLSLFTVNPDILAVTHPKHYSKAVGDYLNSEDELTRRGECLHKRLLEDSEYKELITQLNENKTASIKAIFGNNAEKLQRLEQRQEELEKRLDGYFKRRHIRRETFFPPDFQFNIR